LKNFISNRFNYLLQGPFSAVADKNNSDRTR
jgi:hypothetical protein